MCPYLSQPIPCPFQSFRVPSHSLLSLCSFFLNFFNNLIQVCNLLWTYHYSLLCFSNSYRLPLFLNHPPSTFKSYFLLNFFIQYILIIFSPPDSSQILLPLYPPNFMLSSSLCLSLSKTPQQSQKTKIKPNRKNNLKQKQTKNNAQTKENKTKSPPKPPGSWCHHFMLVNCSSACCLPEYGCCTLWLCSAEKIIFHLPMYTNCEKPLG